MSYSQGHGFTKTPFPHSTKNSLTPKPACIRDKKEAEIGWEHGSNSSWEISSGSRGKKLCHSQGRKGTPEPQPSARGKTQHSARAGSRQSFWKGDKSKERVSLQQHGEPFKELG